MGAAIQQEPLIRFDHASKAFGEKHVLVDMDLEVMPGENFVVMGPSGVGKSVMLRHVIGLLTADSGTVTVEGHDMSTIKREPLAEMRSRMGYLFQEAALLNWLSAGDNVALPLRETTDMPEDEIRDRVQAKLALVHIPDAMDKMRSPE